MTTRAQFAQLLGWAMLTASICQAQPPAPSAPAAPPAPVTSLTQPDAQRTRQELMDLFQRYPPSLRNVLALDPTLLANQSYLAPYPALSNFLATHPEIARNPSFYIGSPDPFRRDNFREPGQVWENIFDAAAGLTAGCLAMSLIAWLIRTFMDYRRWTRLNRVQTDAHTKILDRLTNNEDLIAYVKSPAGGKFLESSPITLDAGTRHFGAPLGRILWAVQGGIVLMAGGVGMWIVGGRASDEAAEPLRALGILGLALGIGFVISAIISFMIARQLGLIERPAEPIPPERAI